MKRINRSIVGFVISMMIGTAFLGSAKMVVDTCFPEQNVIEVETNSVNEEEAELNQMLIEFELARNTLAMEVHEYITSVAPKAEVDPYILIDLCNQYNIDIAFVMAQGQIESHYATAGTARRTNSIFNVGAYDGHSASMQCSNGFGFEDPNDSIEPYLILLTNDYLVNGKTINDLMTRYVNHLGMRYASNPKYESQLKSVYNKIYRNPEFRVAYEEYKNCYNKIC